MTKCINCKASNPKNDKYCGNCGTFLNLNISSPKDSSEPYIRWQIQSILKEQKNQKILDIETTEKIAIRLFKWAKIFSIVVSIPLVLIFGILGFLGIETYEEFEMHVETVEKNITQKSEQLEEEFEEITKKQVNLIDEYKKLETNFDELSGWAQKTEKFPEEIKRIEEILTATKDQIKANLKTIETKIELIEEKVGFLPSPALTEDIEKKLKISFSSFKEYFQKLGFQSPKGPIEIYVTPKLEEFPYYDSEKNRISLGQYYLQDADVVFRLYAHYVLVSLSEESLDGKNTFVGPFYKALESGLADYFTCSFNDDPLLGEVSTKPYNRKLNNERKFYELTVHNPEDAGEIWGGAFWNIREVLGQTTSDKLLFSAWVTMQHFDTHDNYYVNFVNILLKIAQSLDEGRHVGQIRTVFERRGFKF